MSSKINFAVVGCGHIGKRHAAMITNNAECELVALCDTSERDEFGINAYAVPYFNAIEELLASGISIDVVCIATPNGLHEEQALKVLGAGLHVVIEKPMALTTEGCKRIIEEAAKQGRQVFCVMQNRYSPVSIWLKDTIEKKVLGDIYMLQVNCFWNRDERYYKGTSWHGTKKMDGGTLFTQFAHFIDTIYWCFGDIKNISARFYNFNHTGSIDFEDSGFVNFDLSVGGTGTLNYTTAVWKENLESSITIIAQNGTVKIGGQYMDELQYCNIKNYSKPRLPATTTAPNHHFIFENVVDVLKGRVPLMTNVEEGKKVVEIIERIYGSTE